MLATELAQLFQQNEFEKICSYFNQPDGLKPSDDPISCHIYAASLFQLGNYSLCLELLNTLQSSMGDSIEFALLYGATLRRLGQSEEALSFFSKSISSFPNNIALLNNYSNLLIDLERFNEAETILSNILSIDPEYEDAKANFNRLKFSQQSNSTKVSRNDSSTSYLVDENSPPRLDNTYGLDPLLLAFDDQEVEQFGRLKKGQPTLNASDLPNTDVDKVSLDFLKLAQQSIAENEPKNALTLCSKAYKNIGPNPLLYSIVADAFISLALFTQAEIYTLMAMHLSHPTIKYYLNLANISCMRCDFKLANYYLDQASSINPNHEALEKIKSSLDARITSNKNSHFVFCDSSDFVQQKNLRKVQSK